MGPYRCLLLLLLLLHSPLKNHILLRTSKGLVISKVEAIMGAIVVRATVGVEAEVVDGNLGDKSRSHLANAS